MKTVALAACLVLCSHLHPIHTWEHRHHLRRCHTVRCRLADDRGSSSRPRRQGKQLYPCIVRWTYDALPWWHLRFGPRGPYGRNRVGYGPTSYRRCL